jgi:radical SAM superfamily enzyme YgiQ (UPF0313 family)
MVDVLLTHSYFLRFDRKEHRAMMPYPPLGTLYAASVLRRSGITVALHDTMLASSEEALLDAIEVHQPKIVAIYDDQFNYLTKMCLERMRRAAFRMTGLAKARGCKVVVFSSDATDHIQKYIDHGADFVLCGEAEETLQELSEVLLGRTLTPVEDIRGVAYSERASIRRTKSRNVITDLNAFPFPAWDLVDGPRYRSAWRRHGLFSLNMVTTRGCPYHCNWCAKPIYGQVYHSRTPHNVVDEMLLVRERLAPDHLWFADDIFGLKPGWIGTFAGEVERAKAQIPFKCLSRVDLLHREENVKHLKRAGCESVWVGAESGSQKILDAMEKGTTTEQIRQATALLHAQGIRVGFFLQFGYPGETQSDIDQTLDMVRDCRPENVGISVSYPLPGTRFYERVRAELRTKTNWTESADLDLMFAGEFKPEFYRILHRITHKKLRIWQAQGALKELVVESRLPGHGEAFRLVKSLYHAATLPPLQWRLRSAARQSNRQAAV